MAPPLLRALHGHTDLLSWVCLSRTDNYMRFQQYDVGNFFDEMFSAEGCPRPAAQALIKTIETLPAGELLTRQQAAERALLQMGITFNVYGEDAGVEKIFPFDILPRIVSAVEWNRIGPG